MKVAVLFSGIPRDSFKQNISDYKEVFNNADFYYHTWHQYNEELEEYKPLITTSEPNPDYNLYENVDDPFVQSTPFRRVHDTHYKGRLSKSFMSKQRRGVIQFYAYNAVYNLIKNKKYLILICKIDFGIKTKQEKIVDKQSAENPINEIIYNLFSIDYFFLILFL